MRAVLFAALAVPLALISTAEFTSAQPRNAVVARVQRIPPPINQNARFRSRPATVRAADATRLGVRVNAAQLGAPFSITPRVPFIEGRASMETNRTSLEAGFDTTGRLRGRTTGQTLDSLDSDVTFWIYHAANHRFLVDCKVSSYAQSPFRMISVGGASNNLSIVSDVYASAGLVSFVTQSIPQTALIDISLVPPTNANASDVFDWDFMGCEVTPLPA